MNKISKVLYISGGLFFTTLGLAGFGAATYVYQNPFMKADREVIKSTAIKQCATVLRENGFEAKASSSKGTIEITYASLDRWETAMAKISYSIQACEAMDLTDFCMGEICYNEKKFPITGIVANLKYQKPQSKLK